MSIRQRMRSLPWRAIRTVSYSLRVAVFGVPRPEGQFLVADADTARVKTLLKAAHFREEWPFSYYYHGEDINLVRPDLPPDEERFADWQFQTHVRGYGRDDGRLDLQAHYEPCPLNHPKAHLFGTGYDRDRATTTVETILDDAGIEYEQRSGP